MCNDFPIIALLFGSTTIKKAKNKTKQKRADSFWFYISVYR